MAAVVAGAATAATGGGVVVAAIVEGSLEAKLPTIWRDGKAQPGSSSGMETVRRGKLKDGEDQRKRERERKRERKREKVRR